MPLLPSWKRIINFRKGAKKTPEVLKQEQLPALFEKTLKEWNDAGRIGLDWNRFNELVNLKKQIESMRPGITLLDVDKLHGKYNHDNRASLFQTMCRILLPKQSGYNSK